MTLDEWMKEIDACVQDDVYFEVSGEDAGDLWDQINNLKKEHERLQDALADLVAVQNGPPLVTYTEAWDAAMEKAYAALKEGE
jgi:hypothetical protein